MRDNVLLYALFLLFVTSCNDIECINCAEDWDKTQFYKDAKGIVVYHEFLINFKVVELHNNGESVTYIPFPSCGDTSVYSIGTELKISGYRLEVPREGNPIPNPFCYTDIEVVGEIEINDPR